MRPIHHGFCIVGSIALLLLLPLPQTFADDLQQEALAAMKKAVTYHREKVARHGGYVYITSADLSRRWGEGEAGPDTIFVQPPGTPSVGMAYLDAYHATHDRYYLEAATETAMALVNGQLKSGGWTQVIHFAPVKGRMGDYRKMKGGNSNNSSLDDDQTQAALTFLFAVDQAHNFKHPAIHEAAQYGLSALLDAQFDNGGFPQVFSGPAQKRPVLKATYPEYDWKTQGRIKEYWDHYTLNDGLAGTVCRTLIAANATYRDQRCMQAIRRLGDFLILAQMPASQPAWCQQYNEQMKPMWARKFEPPAIAGSESFDAMFTLIQIARITGDAKYLAPIPPALKYLNESLLDDGRMARFYELKTNKPLYMNANYELTYDPDNAPSHYGWRHGSKLDSIAKAYEEARKNLKPSPMKKPVKSTAAQVRQVLASMDPQGRWVQLAVGQPLPGSTKLPRGTSYLSSATFCRNLGVLAAAVREE